MLVAYNYVTCISFVDTVPPTLSCPSSGVVEISEDSQEVTIDFTSVNSGYRDYTVNDLGGEDRVEFSPQSLLITSAFINRTPQTITLRAYDLQQNVASCEFYITVIGTYCFALLILCAYKTVNKI